MSTATTAFEYLLNAMEHAAMGVEPAKEGYAEKRKAVLRAVATLQELADARQSLLDCYRISSSYKSGAAIDRIQAAEANLEDIYAPTKATR